MSWIDDVDALYKDYVENIQKYFILLSAIGGGIPPALSNELRAVLDHISRCYTTTDPNERSDECKHAKAHLLRFKLDVFKTHCMLGAKRYEKFTEDYCGVPIESVGNMRFFSLVLPAYMESNSHHRQARDLESDCKAQALQHYKEATDALIAIDQAFDEFSEEMRRKKDSYLKFKRRITLLSYLMPIISIAIQLVLEYVIS